MSEFDALWKQSVRYRKVSRELEPLLHALFDALPHPASSRFALEQLLTFLASPAGRTDANCTTTYYFTTAAEPRWQSLPSELKAILDDMSGTLQDSVHAENIARTFEATPEQLLERVRRV